MDALREVRRETWGTVTKLERSKDGGNVSVKVWSWRTRKEIGSRIRLSKEAEEHGDRLHRGQTDQGSNHDTVLPCCGTSGEIFHLPTPYFSSQQNKDNKVQTPPNC